MPSPPSPASDKSSVRREQVIQLLQDGAVTTDPSEDCLAVATDMQRLGLIEASTSTFVWCANPHDVDYSESNHYCRGRIYIPENLEESFEDYYCPECDRPVFPDVDEKQQHKELRCQIVPNGVLDYLKSLLEKARLATTSICEGVMRVDVGPLGVFVCVADTCRDPKFMSPAWAATQPTCYVLVNAIRRHFGNESSRRFILLADVICGQMDLAAAVRQTIEMPPNGQILNGIVPVYDEVSTAAHPMAVGRRQFTVAVSNKGVWVEGLKVIGSRSPVRLTIFRLLWKSFVKDLFRGIDPAEFRAHPLHMIRPILESRVHKRYPDETTVRRLINRLQSDLETMVRRELGLPIDREDLVQTCDWQCQGNIDFGYRLNPACVVVAAEPRMAQHELT